MNYCSRCFQHAVALTTVKHLAVEINVLSFRVMLSVCLHNTEGNKS